MDFIRADDQIVAQAQLGQGGELFAVENPSRGVLGIAQQEKRVTVVGGHGTLQGIPVHLPSPAIIHQRYRVQLFLRQGRCS
jgi:hypothetical protein